MAIRLMSSMASTHRFRMTSTRSLHRPTSHTRLHPSRIWRRRLRAAGVDLGKSDVKGGERDRTRGGV